VGIAGFERRLENLVEGVFARVFRSGVRPVELGRRVAREMDIARSVDVQGRLVVPNDFSITVSTTDDEQLGGIRSQLEAELADAAREHARDEGYVFRGPVATALGCDPNLRTGEFRIEARMQQGIGGVGPGTLVLPDGQRFVLDADTVHVGRAPDCEVVLVDAKVSRHHAEIRPRGDEFVLVDQGSTNGTRVNGVGVTEQTLRDGDDLGFGNTHLRFEAS
jgi:hypothetical protein